MNMRRDSQRSGLKARGRSRGEVATRQTEVEEASGARRNDLLPSLKIETCPIDTLKSYSRKLRKSESVHVHEIANSMSTLGFNVPLLIGISVAAKRWAVSRRVVDDCDGIRGRIPNPSAQAWSGETSII
jgi:hypothetical protein